MAASACGSVWVWRDYTFRNTQRLATAWPVRVRPGLQHIHGLGPGLSTCGDTWVHAVSCTTQAMTHHQAQSSSQGRIRVSNP